MSINNERNLNPSPLSKEDIKLIAFQIVGYLKTLEDKPMNGDEASRWWGISKPTFYRLVKKGIISGRQLTENGDATFLKSEIITAIKNSPKWKP